MVLPISPQTARQLLDQLLDKGYARATDRVIRALVEVPKRGVLAKRLYDLEQEARRLSRADERLDPRNPVYLALLRDLDPALQQAARLVDAAGVDVQEAGITAGAEGARRLTGASYLGLHWNVPDPEAVARLVNYTGKSAWAGAVGDYPKAIIQTINRLALRNFLAGMNPLQSSRLIRQQVENLPAATANNLLRTLQLTAYRDSTAESYKANADILDGQIRLANLDTRCCMACVVLHGTELPVGDRVDEHHQGRCTSIGKLKGRRYDIESGMVWFGRQTPERQQALMGGAAFRAWKAGEIRLPDFVGNYRDPVFGRMVRENSLKGMIGDRAKRYYSIGGRTPLAAAEPAYTSTRIPPVGRAHAPDFVLARARKLLGRDITLDELAALTGASGGEEVWIDTYGDGLELRAVGRRLRGMTRQLNRDVNNVLYLYNDFFATTEKGTGIGAEYFYNEVQAAARAGIGYIKVYAAGDRHSETFNGYYTWARFGYDAELDSINPFLQRKIPAALGNPETMQQLMATKAGRDWWKEHGQSWDGAFDLRDDSLSRRVLENYMQERGIIK
ncbi:MAG TPA: hypothetical protein VHO69_11195 [Phototrophicaceae bacterium]|nr:hypothetical protein [Phototrophicaceae bacterium]